MTQSRYPGPTETAVEAPAGGGRPLPPVFRAEMESILGIDLAAVRVHEGSQASAAGALAFTRGTDIHFAPGQYDPDSERGRDLLGHELAHVEQQARGAVRPNLSIAGLPVNDDAGLESEADRIGQLAARGDGAQEQRGGALRPAPSEGAVAQRKIEFLDGNPQDDTDSNGNVASSHHSPSLSDATAGPAAPAPAHAEARHTHVKVVATSSKPHRVEPAGPVPTTSTIYQEAASTEAAAPAGYRTITGFDGTMTAPQVEQVATNSLYIDGKPRADDIDQGGFGTCYFLAAAASIASRDPGKIKSIMAPNGSGGAIVALWRAERHIATYAEMLAGTAPKHDWHMVLVTVSDELAYNIADGELRSSDLRCAPNPRSSDYWAAVSGTDLEVHRKDTYDLARWVPLLEKAYARFAETHEQYGGRYEGKQENSGYDAVDGGVAHKAMSVLYGPEGDDKANKLTSKDITWSPDGDLVTANAAVMNQLLQLNGRGEETQDDHPDAPVVTASVQVDPLINRLLDAIPAAMDDPDWVNIDSVRQAAVIEAQAIAGAWKALPDDQDPPAPQPKAEVQSLIGDACARAIRPGIDESTAEKDALRGFHSLNPGTIRFAKGSDSVGAAQVTQLNDLGAALIDAHHPKIAVHIEGHASEDGAPDPLALSERRAQNVEAELLLIGPVEPHTTSATGKGDRPVPATGPERTAEVTILPAGHSHNDLLDNRRSEPIRAMADLMLNLRNIGTDASSGQRNVYGAHAYSIVSVDIVGLGGTTLPFAITPPGLRTFLYPLVDASASRVRIRNPHHSNEPDRLDSNSPSDGRDGAPAGDSSDGVFTMSLREFFLNFTVVRAGVFPKTTAGK